jgi:hypothetical protein
VEHDEIVREYWHYYALAFSQSRADRLIADDARRKEFRAWQHVNTCVQNATDGVGRLLQRLADAAPTDEQVRALGAGHLEDLLNETPAAFAREVLPLLASSERLRLALGACSADNAAAREILKRAVVIG